MATGVGLSKAPVDRLLVHTDRLLQRTVGRSIPAAFYEARYRRDLGSYPHAPAVVRVRRVPTDSIAYVTGRKAPWRNRPASLGRVRDGDWDRDHGFTIDDGPFSYRHVRGDRVTDWLLYDAIEARIDGGAWADTALVDLARSEADVRPLSRRYRTEASICRWLDDLDELIASITTHGLLSNRAFHEATGRPTGVLERHLGEVFVDVGRDGELLFVDGKHRLCIARALGLETVPVATLVYHRRWAERRFTG